MNRHASTITSLCIDISLCEARAHEARLLICEGENARDFRDPRKLLQVGTQLTTLFRAGRYYRAGMYYTALGLYRLHASNRAQAESLLLTVAESAHDIFAAMAWLALGSICQRAGDHEQAMRYYDKAEAACCTN